MLDKLDAALRFQQEALKALKQRLNSMENYILTNIIDLLSEILMWQ